nr:MAG TPA: hypothetical protein [Caudoviricetes sp.]
MQILIQALQLSYTKITLSLTLSPQIVFMMKIIK